MQAIDIGWLDSLSKVTISGAAIGAAIYLARLLNRSQEKEREFTHSQLSLAQNSFQKTVEKTAEGLAAFSQVRDSLTVLVQTQKRQGEILEDINRHIRKRDT